MRYQHDPTATLTLRIANILVDSKFANATGGVAHTSFAPIGVPAIETAAT